MSAEKQMPLEERIHEYLQPHAFGKTREKVVSQFDNAYDENKIRDTIKRMESNGWIREQAGKLKWKPKPGGS